MVTKDLVTAKLSELIDRIDRARAHCPPDVKLLGSDRDALDLVSFNLMLAVQACADVASHLIADAGWPAARSLAEAFERLVEHEVTSSATGEQLERAVGLRNVVAHGYARVSVAMIHEAATEGVRDLEAFAHDVAVYLQTLPS